MFKTKPTDSFKFKVQLHAPGVGRVTCGFEGRHLDGDALQEAMAGSDNDAEFVQAVVTGWNRKDFDADFSDAELAAMLKAYPGLGTQIARAYLAELSGAPQVKNSPMPAVTGL